MNRTHLVLFSGDPGNRWLIRHFLPCPTGNNCRVPLSPLPVKSNAKCTRYFTTESTEIHRGKQNLRINSDIFPHSIFSVLSVSSVVHSPFGSGFAGLGFVNNMAISPSSLCTILTRCSITKYSQILPRLVCSFAYFAVNPVPHVNPEFLQSGMIHAPRYGMRSFP